MYKIFDYSGLSNGYKVHANNKYLKFLYEIFNYPLMLNLTNRSTYFYQI